MIILDVHIPPSLALWITSNFQLECYPATYLNLREAEDNEIFSIARDRNAIVITKMMTSCLCLRVTEVLQKLFGLPAVTLRKAD